MEKSLIHKRLKEVRKRLKITQSELAQKLGKTLTMTQNYEYGKSTITDGVLLRLQESFNVNPRWMRTGEGEMFLNEIPKDNLDNNEALPREHTLVMHAVRHMSVEEAQDLLKYIENLEAAKKYREILKKEQAG